MVTTTAPRTSAQGADMTESHSVDRKVVIYGTIALSHGGEASVGVWIATR